MTNEQRGELTELIRPKIEKPVASMPYLEEESRAIAPNPGVGNHPGSRAAARTSDPRTPASTRAKRMYATLRSQYE
ncbi:MAG: hypothetical protein ACLFPO_04045 [Spirochaetaceae bacterium]